MPCLDPILRIASMLRDHVSAGTQSGCLIGQSCNRRLGLDASGGADHPPSGRVAMAENRRAEHRLRVFFERQSSGQPVVLAVPVKGPSRDITPQNG